MRSLFRSKLIIAALIILILTVAVIIFNHYSHLPHDNPLLGVFTFSLVPVLFVAGAVVFVRAILKS
jgi:hypothetical protein